MNDKLRMKCEECKRYGAKQTSKGKLCKKCLLVRTVVQFFRGQWDAYKEL